MTKFTAQTEKFLADHTGLMTRELAEIVMARYGGEEDFLSNYGYVVDGKINGGINGFISTYEMVQFFTANKDAIINFAKEVFTESGYSSMSEMVKDFGILNGGYSSEEVAIGIFDKESKDHYTMAEALVFFVGEELAHIYDSFMEYCKEESEA